jgi:hypothetical protein
LFTLWFLHPRGGLPVVIVGVVVVVVIFIVGVAVVGVVVVFCRRRAPKFDIFSSDMFDTRTGI